ncbi:hypothetical protein LJC15_03045 [Desulfovibrio sp. OttesenSCG-928-G11]|nr:hypothetical protein [Desulfovibrio sp. OttesenSCG-928-G11]
MLALLGILGFIQGAFLPGVLLLAWRGKIAQWPLFFFLSFGISLTISYVLAMVLVAVGLYTQTTMLLLFGLEVAGGFFLWRKNKLLLPKLSVPSCKSLEQSFARQPWFTLGIVFFWGFLTWLGYCYLRDLGNVFTNWDPIVSWNKWAALLADNNPVSSFHYPQLLPVLLSVPYVFMGNTDLQFFSYALCGLFLPMSCLAAYSLYGQKPFVALFTALVCAYWFQAHAFRAGNADFPVLAMGLFTLCALLCWCREATEGNGKDLTLLFFAAALAGGTAATKQAGLALLCFFPFITYELGRGLPAHSRPKLVWIFQMTALAALVSLPWYLYARYQISVAANASELHGTWVMAHEGRDLMQRLAFALKQSSFVFLLALICLPNLLHKELRAITALGLVLTIFWAIMLSYDSRNVSLAIPFLAFSAGHVLLGLRGNLPAWNIKCKKILPSLLAVAAILAIALLILFSDQVKDKLYIKQDKQAMHMGPGRLFNSEMMKELKKRPGFMITSYSPMVMQLRMNPEDFLLYQTIYGAIGHESFEKAVARHSRVYFYIFLDGEQEALQAAFPDARLVMERRPYALFVLENHVAIKSGIQP